MVNINKHKFFLLQILKEIYTDIELASCLGFKGGTALMFFYDLPRISIDLAFNLLDKSKEKLAYEKVRKILLGHGRIFDEAMKFYGSIIVLDYGVGERKLKIEISNRQWNDRYEVKYILPSKGCAACSVRRLRTKEYSVRLSGVSSLLCKSKRHKRYSSRV